MYDASTDIKDHIAKRARQMERNFAAGDASSLVQDYYVPDDLEPIVSAGDKAVVGRAALVTLFEGLCQTFTEARQVPLTIRADKNLAYEVSNAYMTARDTGDIVEFRYLATWRLCEDGWRVEADFFALGQV